MFGIIGDLNRSRAAQIEKLELSALSVEVSALRGESLSVIRAFLSQVKSG